MQQRTMTITIICLFLVILLSNIISPVPDMRYSNEDGSFTFAEMNVKGRDFAMCQRKFNHFLQQGPAFGVLYRLNERHIWAFWNYRHYFTKPQYMLPYKSEESLRSHWGPQRTAGAYQDFVFVVCQPFNPLRWMN